MCLKVIADRPGSFDVFADDFGEMETQAREIASWAQELNGKITRMNTEEFAARLVRAGCRKRRGDSTSPR